MLFVKLLASLSAFINKFTDDCGVEVHAFSGLVLEWSGRRRCVADAWHLRATLASAAAVRAGVVGCGYAALRTVASAG